MRQVACELTEVSSGLHSETVSKKRNMVPCCAPNRRKTSLSFFLSLPPPYLNRPMYYALCTFDIITLQWVTCADQTQGCQQQSHDSHYQVIWTRDNTCASKLWLSSMPFLQPSQKQQILDTASVLFQVKQR